MQHDAKPLLSTCVKPLAKSKSWELLYLFLSKHNLAAQLVEKIFTRMIGKRFGLNWSIKKQRHESNHRIKGLTVGNEPIWKVERQPVWLVVAIKKTITDLPGGYAEAAEWLGVTENALFNRLRVDGDQIFPMGWAMVLQKAAGVSYIADAFSRQTDNGIHIPGAAPEAENEEIGLKLAELVGRLGDLVNAYRRYIDDGVVDKGEWDSLNEIAYQFRVTLMTFLNLISRVYCLPEKNEARECAAPGSVACRISGETNA